MPTHTIETLVGERQTLADVGDEPPGERRDDDGDATHRRRALLGHVVLRPVILLAEDRLAEAAGAEQRDERPRGEQ